MLTTQNEINTIATRIERAYRLRRSEWQARCSTQKVWSAAAVMLHNIHENDPTIPIDPELFVAAQPHKSIYADPWIDLVDSGSARRYLEQIERITRNLRDEMTAEVCLAESRIQKGRPIGRVLTSQSRRLSPLGRYIVAHRAGRPALSARFLVGALAQHKACPLYRRACSTLLPAEAYPQLETGRRLAGSGNLPQSPSLNHVLRN
ncbi:MAG: hypothetical protein NVSMB9_13600 [Isosphaeraceae bacterium]